MSRKMDSRVTLMDELKKTRAEITEIGKTKRKLEAKASEIEQSLLKSMGKSTIGTVDGESFIEVYTSSRRSIRIETAEKVCPNLLDKLITKTESKKVKFL